MGAFHSRRNAGVEELDLSSSNAYRYPPKSGCYFGNYFMMGGERFDTTQPEAYLFGENQDLNFLGCRPVPFPYPAPQANEPTKTLKSLVNIRKDSIHFIRLTNPDESSTDPDAAPYTKYNIEFTFDTDVRVAITIHYFATEEVTPGHIVYRPRDSCMNSETYHYKRGANQTFAQSTHIVDPSKFPEEDWQYNPDKEVFPVVIHCVVEDDQHTGSSHSHSSFAVVEKGSDGHFVLKPLKQKQMVDGLCYLLQEIYGIENKNTTRPKIIDEELDDNSLECVICMSDVRDTLILPCRHLCLCNGCADSLRYQANNCPICRAPFRALLQIRAMRKKHAMLPSPPQSDSDDNGISQEGVPTGYEAVSLIEALNGPVTTHTQHTHHFTTDGNSRSASLPTSPEDSPLMIKKNASKKRQASVLSNQSGRAVDTVIEEAAQATEMTALTPPEPSAPPIGSEATSPDEPPTPREGSVKSKKERSSSKRRSRKEKMEKRMQEEREKSNNSSPPSSAAQSPRSEEVVEIVDEIKNDLTETVSLEGSDLLNGSEDADVNDLSSHSRRSIVLDAVPVLNRTEPILPGALDSSAAMEGSLPGTPSLTDGSGYSSTSSSRMLLSQGSSPGAFSTASNASKSSSVSDIP